VSETLRNRTVSALLWSAVERFGQQGIRFGTTIILARLLTPQDFGVLGILMVFIIVAESVVNSGFGSALIQKKDVTEDDLTTAFVISVSVAAVLYTIVFLFAGAIGRFYGQPELEVLTKVLAVVILLDAFVVIQRVQFERQLNFRSLSKITVISTLLSGVVGVALALWGFGVWSLIAQLIAQKVILAVFLWYHSIWVPRGSVSLESFRGLFSYGWKLQVSGILDSFFRNIHALIIGRYFAVDIVGYYTQAKKLKDLPLTNLSAVVGKVTFPAFSSIQDDLPRLKRGYRQSITMLVLVAFPMVVGMFVTAPRLIPVVFGNQWIASIPFFRLLCLVGLLYVLQASNMNILKVTGRTDIFLKLEIVKKLLTVAAVLISIRWGVYALVIGQVVTSYIAFLLNAGFSGRLIDYPIREQVLDVLPYLGLSLIMGGTVWLIGFVPIPIAWIVLLFQTMAGVLVYAALNHVFSMLAWKSFLSLRSHKSLGKAHA
jgi:teichuronic acid exporter